jgi:hypothetical protein
MTDVHLRARVLVLLAILPVGCIPTCSPSPRETHELAYAVAQEQEKVGCGRGDMNLCRAYAWNHDPHNDRSPLPKDAKLAAEFYEKACAGGVAVACLSLGLLNINADGRGLTTDVPKAVRALDRTYELDRRLGYQLMTDLSTSEAAEQLLWPDRTMTVRYPEGQTAWQRVYAKGTLASEQVLDPQGRPVKDLSAALLEAVVAFHAKEGRVCGIHDGKGPTPPPAGSVVVGFDVDQDGSVSGVQPVREPPGDSPVTRCVEGLVRSWKFPRSTAGGPWHGSYTWQG